MMTMPIHPNEEALQRLRHAELAGHELLDLHEHLGVCADCRARAARLAQDESEVLALLQSLDEPTTPMHADQVIARWKSESRLARYRLAASLLFAMTVAGVAYAMPGSPVTAWFRSVVARFPHEEPALPALTSPSATSGIAVAPGEHFVIHFAAASPQSEAFVTLTDDSTITVRAALGSATFTSEADRLVIEPRGSALSVEIRIPRQAPRVEIHVAHERVFLKNGMEITALDAALTRERYRIALTPLLR